MVFFLKFELRIQLPRSLAWYRVGWEQLVGTHLYVQQGCVAKNLNSHSSEC